MSAAKEKQERWVPLAHSGISEKDIHAQVEILCHSAALENQGNAKKLLRFLVEKAIQGRTPSMRELSTLFRQIPRPSDNLVCNAARRLRLCLAEPYQKHANATEIHLDVPPGQYGVFASKAPTGRRQAVNLDTRAIATILEPVQNAEVYRRVTVRGRIFGTVFRPCRWRTEKTSRSCRNSCVMPTAGAHWRFILRLGYRRSERRSIGSSS
jgi:hypothetical protein